MKTPALADSDQVCCEVRRLTGFSTVKTIVGIMAGGYALIVSHRVTCGNIPTSVMQNATEKNKDTGGEYIKPNSGQSTSTSNKGGRFVRSNLEEDS